MISPGRRCRVAFARVSDVGKLENGSPYMVMEYLDGTDLAGMLSRRGALAIEEAVEFVLQACEALAEAHVLGIVHRDLKPANLYCIRRADGRLSIKVLDFGISKLTSPGQDASMTRTTAIMGSPLYMSPEQMQSSKRVDARSDIWALGIILFELVTGRPPFEAEAVTELIIKIATERPAPTASLRPDVPAALDQIIMRCLEKDPERRFRNVGELALALEPFAPPRARSSVERILGTLQAAGVSAVGTPSGPGAPNDPRNPQGPRAGGRGTEASWGATGATTGAGKSQILVIAIGAGLLLLGTGLFLVVKKGGAPDSLPGAASASAAASPATTASAAAVAPVAPAAPSCRHWARARTATRGSPCHGRSRGDRRTDLLACRCGSASVGEARRRQSQRGSHGGSPSPG